MSDEIVDVLKNTRHMTLSTVCENGSPWGTPVRFIFRCGKIYWTNVDKSVHMGNIRRDNRIFISVVNYDQEKYRAAYIKTVAKQIAAVKNPEIFAKFFKSGKYNPKDFVLCSADIGRPDASKPREDRLYYYVNEEAK